MKVGDIVRTNSSACKRCGNRFHGGYDYFIVAVDFYKYIGIPYPSVYKSYENSIRSGSDCNNAIRFSKISICEDCDLTFVGHIDLAIANDGIFYAFV